MGLGIGGLDRQPKPEITHLADKIFVDGLQ